MSLRTGFGNLTDELISTNIPASDEPAPTNRNAVINLQGKTNKRITDISASYAIPFSNNTSVMILGGRLLVVGVKCNDHTEFISPSSRELPASLSGGAVYLDIFFGQNYNNNQMPTNFIYQSAKGINIPKTVDACVILTFAMTDDIVYPESGLVIASLNVDGTFDGMDAPYKNLR